MIIIISHMVAKNKYVERVICWAWYLRTGNANVNSLPQKASRELPTIASEGSSEKARKGDPGIFQPRVGQSGSVAQILPSLG